MHDPILDLKRVNWQHGMLLAPDHLLQQERYFESCMQWYARYCSTASGILGRGLRNPAELASPSQDPVLSIQQDDRTLKISVRQLRAVAESGQIFEIDESNTASGEFALHSLEGQQQVDVYVTTDASEVKAAGEPDAINPDVLPYRIQQFRVELNLDERSPYESRILVTRLRRAERKEKFEQVMGFIPPCASVTAHSEMARAWRSMLDAITSMTELYIELHRSIVEYVVLCENKGIELREDLETMDFVSRMVVALEHCIYEILDPSTAPARFMQEVYRVVRSAAVFLELSPPTRTYFERLANAGETEFLPLVSQQLNTLRFDRRLIAQRDIQTEISTLMEGISRLRRLAEALGGKYLDYRLSPSLAALGFVIDREHQTLYKAVSRVTNKQATFSENTFVFVPRIELTGRERYRIILIGDANARFDLQSVLRTTLQINVSGGTRSEPKHPSAVCEVPGQRNFAIDFETGEIGAITDIRLSMSSNYAISNAMLYIKKYLTAEKSVERTPAPEPPQPITPRPMTPVQPPIPQPVTPRPQPQQPPQGKRRATIVAPPPGPRRSGG